MSSTTIWHVIVKSTFSGNQEIAKGRPNCISRAGSPDNVVTAPKGTLCRDTTNSITYVNTGGSTNWLPLDE